METVLWGAPGIFQLHNSKGRFSKKNSVTLLLVCQADSTPLSRLFSKAFP